MNVPAVIAILGTATVVGGLWIWWQLRTLRWVASPRGKALNKLAMEHSARRDRTQGRHVGEWGWVRTRGVGRPRFGSADTFEEAQMRVEEPGWFPVAVLNLDTPRTPEPREPEASPRTTPP